MATKTISVELDAYELLRSRKREERESFSQVIRRLGLQEGRYALGLVRALQEEQHTAASARTHALPDQVLVRMREAVADWSVQREG